MDPSPGLIEPRSGRRLSLVDSPEELERLRDFWQLLVWHPYTDLDYYLTELQTDPSVVRPYALVLQQNGRPTGLAVGRVVDAGLNIQFGYKTVLKPSLRTLVIHSRGILGDTSEAACKWILDALLEQLAAGAFDLVRLQGLPLTSPLYPLARGRPAPGMRDWLPAVAPSWQLKCFESYEQFLRAHPKLKKNLKYYSNLMRRYCGGAETVKCFSDRTDLDFLMSELETVAAKSWQRGLGVGYVCDAKTRKMFDFMMTRGWLRAYVLYMDEKPVAFNYGVRYGTLFVDETPGFDPAYGKFRVGKYMFLKVIEMMHQDDEVERIDFGPGNAQDKQLYCNQSELVSDVLIFAPRPRLLAMNVLRSVIAIAHRRIKDVLGRTGYEAQAKRYWRQRAARKASSIS